MTAPSLPPLGRCALCGHRRHLSGHRSTRDRLLRLLCTPCYSGAVLAEEAGHTVDWDQVIATGSEAELERWLGGEQ